MNVDARTVDMALVRDRPIAVLHTLMTAQS
jgi:hypothetical protein